jgi:hypothetical protein
VEFNALRGVPQPDGFGSPKENPISFRGPGPHEQSLLRQLGDAPASRPPGHHRPRELEITPSQNPMSRDPQRPIVRGPPDVPAPFPDPVGPPRTLFLGRRRFETCHATVRQPSPPLRPVARPDATAGTFLRSSRPPHGRSIGSSPRKPISCAVTTIFDKLIASAAQDFKSSCCEIH